MRWTVLIPAKALPEAKSRLAPMSSDPQAHRRLVEAIRADTIAAARATDVVARVVVIADRGGVGNTEFVGAEVFVQSEPGLDAAVREGAALAARSWPDDGIAALVGDLPALRPAELAQALTAAAALAGSFVPDASGTGTTLLASTPGTELRPAFGLDSALHHGVHATALDVGPGLRHDVDTADDLHRAAADLGVGAATARVLADLDVPVRSTCIGMMGP